MNQKPGVAIPLSLGEIYVALCPDCQKAIVDLVAAKAGPEFIRSAVANQLAAATAPEPEYKEPPDRPSRDE